MGREGEGRGRKGKEGEGRGRKGQEREGRGRKGNFCFFLLLFLWMFFVILYVLATGSLPERTMAPQTSKKLGTGIPYIAFWESFCALEAFKFTLVWICFFDQPFGRHFPDFVRQRGFKGVPKGTILSPLGGTCGNVKTMVSSKRNHRFEGWRGSRESSCEALCAQCFSACFWELFCFRFFADLGRIGAHWRPLGVTFSLCFAYFYINVA